MAKAKDQSNDYQPIEPGTLPWLDMTKPEPSLFKRAVSDPVAKHAARGLVLLAAAFLAVVIVIAGIGGIVRAWTWAFPPAVVDPNAPQKVVAPESMARALYNQDRDKLDAGFWHNNPWPTWDYADNATQEIYRKKAIAQMQGKPIGEPGQLPPQ